MMIRRRAPLALLAALGALLLAGCATPAPVPAGSASAATTASKLLAAHGLEQFDAPALVDHLESLPLAERPGDLIASVRADRVELSDSTGRTATLPLPDDLFYASVAPFRERTHECFFHSLTTCVGELASEQLQVTVIADDGTVLVDEQRTTNDNGFVGLWLPRGITGTIRIAHEDGRAESTLSTADDAATCITTLQVN